MFLLFFNHITMASSKSEIELSPLPSKDEVDGKPDAEIAEDNLTQSKVALTKQS